MTLPFMHLVKLTQHYSNLKYKILYTRFARTARRILTDLEFSKTELVKYCKVDPSKIVVIPLGHEHLLRIKPDVTILEKLSLEPKKYLLSVGSASPHKNFKVIIEALNLIPDWDKKLVVTGAAFEKVFSAKDMAFPEHIIHTGYISDEELAALYQNAAAVIVPSFYEGFGLPILEGLAFGCPVISSTAASLPEVGGDVVTYFDPMDPASLAEILRTSKFTFEMDKVQEQLDHFKWQNSATIVLNELMRIS